MAQKKGGVWNSVEPFVLGGSSGMLATVVIQPIDMIKVRIQLAGEGAKGSGASPIALTRQIIAQEGFMSLYKGLGAALLRQATYTTTRLGIFRSITNHFDQRGTPASFVEKAVAGLVAGGIGAVVGTPADLALIRMQSDGTLPVDQRRNYKGVFDALARIVREEGAGGVFKGCTPVVVRAMSLNLGMLAGHDQVFQEVKKSTGNVYAAHFAAKMTAGFLASAMSLPFDFVKTRIQKQKPDANGVLPYKSSLDCAGKVLKAEGPGAFYRGFWTYYIRIAPHAMITLLCLDALTAVAKDYKK